MSEKQTERQQRRAGADEEAAKKILPWLKKGVELQGQSWDLVEKIATHLTGDRIESANKSDPEAARYSTAAYMSVCDAISTLADDVCNGKRKEPITLEDARRIVNARSPIEAKQFEKWLESKEKEEEQPQHGPGPLTGKRFRTKLADNEDDDDYGEVSHPIGSTFIVGDYHLENGGQYDVAWEYAVQVSTGKSVPSEGMSTYWTTEEIATQADELAPAAVLRDQQERKG
jgi:hypothetical protein